MSLTDEGFTLEFEPILLKILFFDEKVNFSVSNLAIYRTLRQFS
jgi:hypothetical protein